MSLFKKFFGSNNPTSEEEKEKSNHKFVIENDTPIEEKFIFNFSKNGGKFLYCENEAEIAEQFENILAENDWFEGEALCYEPSIFHVLDENKVKYLNIKNPSFIVAQCENLIADEGSILFSSNQIKQHKPYELPANIIVFAKTSQIIESKSDGLSVIKKKYVRDYPTNITTIKYFKKVDNEDFTQYGSAPKNLYLLLLEDL